MTSPEAAWYPVNLTPQTWYTVPNEVLDMVNKTFTIDGAEVTFDTKAFCVYSLLARREVGRMNGETLPSLQEMAARGGLAVGELADRLKVLVALDLIEEVEG